MYTNGSHSIYLRPAKDHEFDLIGRVCDAAFKSDPLDQYLCSDVSSPLWRQRYWIEGAGQDVKKGLATVTVAVEKETSDIVGLLWFESFSTTNPPKRLSPFQCGFNWQEYEMIAASKLAGQEYLQATYKEYVCE